MCFRKYVDDITDIIFGESLDEYEKIGKVVFREYGVNGLNSVIELLYQELSSNYLEDIRQVEESFKNCM